MKPNYKDYSDGEFQYLIKIKSSNYNIINLLDLAHALLIKGACTLIYGLMTMVSDANFISMVKAAIRIQSSWSIFK